MASKRKPRHNFLRGCFARRTDEWLKRRKMSVGRPLKKPSCSEFCRVCGCNFNTYYGDFKQRVPTENLFEIPKRAGVEKEKK